MEFIVKNQETLARIKESAEFRQMFKDVIKTQIQSLIDQLAYTGEESVLLTSCIRENDTSENVIIGSEMGVEYLAQDGVMKRFREFCSKKTVENILRSNKEPDRDTASPTPAVKRKVGYLNGVEKSESSEADVSTPEVKRSRLSTPLSSSIPKGHSRCSLCTYTSKFKANVTRHERLIHRINLEGSPVPIVMQYACAVCEYKSTYRSNVMRHEKNVHKLESSTADLENRKVSSYHYGEDSSSQGMITDGNQSMMSDRNQPISSAHGTQLFLNQTGSNDDNQMSPVDNKSLGFGNQSVPNSRTESERQTEDGGHFDSNIGGTEYGKAADNTSAAVVDLKSEIPDDEVDEKTNGDFDDGCHICNHCQLIFKSSVELKEHINSAHFAEGVFPCEKCQWVGNSEISLQIHMSTHSSSKQEVCACGKAFQYRTSLIRHQKKCDFKRPSQESSNVQSMKDGDVKKEREVTSEPSIGDIKAEVERIASDNTNLQ